MTDLHAIESDEILVKARATAIAENRCFSKGRLKDEFRMKPKPGAQPVTHFKNGYGGRFAVYAIADCVPMRKKSPLPLSEAQTKAAELLVMRAKLKSRESLAGKAAIKLISEKPLFFDTETTGLGDDAEIIEICICDADGLVMLDTMIKPTVGIEPEAAAVHGIGVDDLTDAPAWLDVCGQISEILSGRSVVAFNADFDVRLLRQTAAAVGDDAAWIKSLRVSCAMGLAVEAYGSTNRYGSISLSSAMAASGTQWRGRSHSALADTLATRDLVVSIADYRHELEAMLQA